MQEIRCPNCGEVFQVDETGYEQIAQQVRNKEFEKELEEKLRYAQEELKQCRKKLGVQQRALFEYESSQELKLGRRCMRVVNFIKKITARIRRKQG